MTYGDFDKLLPNLCKELNGTGISLIVKETQSLKQDGTVFDGKKYCGSSFETGYVNTAYSNNIVSTTSKKESNVKNIVTNNAYSGNSNRTYRKLNSSVKTTRRKITPISKTKAKKVIVVVKTVVKKKYH